MTGPATTRVDVEEIETTKSEKLLAVVLAAFLLIGGLWTYDKLGELAQRAVGPDAGLERRPAIDRLTAAEARAVAASGEEQRALDALVLAREAYRTALDADEPAASLRLEYQAAERAHARAEAKTRAARAVAAAARPAGLAAQESSPRTSSGPLTVGRSSRSDSALRSRARCSVSASGFSRDCVEPARAGSRSPSGSSGSRPSSRSGSRATT